MDDANRLHRASFRRTRIDGRVNEVLSKDPHCEFARFEGTLSRFLYFEMRSIFSPFSPFVAHRGELIYIYKTHT